MAGGIALIQGASRGIGLQFCRSLLQSRPGVKVIGTCRDPNAAHQLQTLKVEFPGALTVLSLDVTKPEDLLRAAENVQRDFPCLDLLINCTAMLHPSGRGETSLREVTAEGLSHTFATNTIGPLLMVKHFSPLLLKGTGAFGAGSSDKTKEHRAILVNMSAKVGSVGDNRLGGWYSYRMSKAALNMATKNLSVELGRGRSKVICVSLHPGTVETGLSRPYHKNVPKEKLFTPEHSVNCLMRIIEHLSIKETGRFFAWDGSELPW